MKNSFSSNTQLCHVWAQLTQPSGHTKNLYFENFTDLYSYGSHYLAAKIHTVNGERVALLRSDSYSSSTSGHLSDARKAVDGLMPHFRVPDVRTLNSLENFNHFNDSVIDYIECILKTIKVTNQRWITWPFEMLERKVSEANEFFKFAGYPTIKIPESMLELLREHLTYRLKRYQELNTPEQIAKREKESAHKAALKELNDLKKLQFDIDQWRAGSNSHGLMNSLKFDLLRVKGQMVQTSRGAEVPLHHALRLLTLIERNQARTGEKIGHFTLERTWDQDGETIVKIGCHTVKLSEAQSVLAPYREQQLKIAE